MILTLCSLVFLFQPLSTSQLPVGIPQLQIQKGDVRPSSIDELHYEIEVLGFLAQTTVTLKLSDPDYFNQEATLLVQLPRHSTVDGFQLGIGKVMVDGVIQEKHLARIGFDREKRKRVDPGLIEWLGNDLYRIRVFPLRNSLSRRVSFQYLSPLTQKEREDVYRLDLSGVAKRTQLKVSLLQRDGMARPQIISPKSFQQKQVEPGTPWRFASNGPLEEPLVFSWQEGQRSSTMLAKDGATWRFALRSALPQSQAVVLPKPQNVVVFWDASGSRGEALVAKETDALLRLISFRNPSTVTLIPFRDRQQEPTSFSTTSSGKKALQKALENLAYDGGTNVHDLKLPPEIQAEEIWMFTDGHDTLGLPLSHAFGDLPTFAFSASKAAQWSYLEKLCEDHQGRALFWDHPSEQQLHTLFHRYESHFEGLIPGQGTLLAVHETKTSATNSLLAAGEVSEHPQIFSLQKDSQQQLLGRVKDLTHDPVAISWINRFIAGRKLQQWQGDPDYYREEILDLGDTHGLVTPHTTLIVFETLQQYAANGLMPPANAPFDIANMPDMTPDKERLKRLKANYFEGVARIWEHQIRREQVETAIFLGEVLTDEDLQYLPQSRDPWAVLTTIPGIHTNRVNIGGSEVSDFLVFTQVGVTTGSSNGGSNASWVMDGVEFTDSVESTDGLSILELENSWRQVEPGINWHQVEAGINKIKTQGDHAYGQYLTLKSILGSSPVFYYRSAQYFAEIGQHELARRIATNLLELDGQDDSRLFAAGMLFHFLEDFDLAMAVYQNLAKNRPEWPQPRMLVAQIHRERAIGWEKTNPPAAIAAYKQAFTLYQDLVTAPWGTLDTWDQLSFLRENRFPHVVIQAMEEAFWIQNRLALLGETVALELNARLKASPEDIKADMRVLLWWDDENANLDLWVSEDAYDERGNAEDYFYLITGQTLDQKRGLGPESFRQKKNPAGNFAIQARYRNSVFSQLKGPVFVKAEIWTHYGTPDEAYRVEIQCIQPRNGEGFLIEKLTWPLE